VRAIIDFRSFWEDAEQGRAVYLEAAAGNKEDSFRILPFGPTHALPTLNLLKSLRKIHFDDVLPQVSKEPLRRAGKWLEAAPLFYIARFSFPSSNATSCNVEIKNPLTEVRFSVFTEQVLRPRTPVKRFFGYVQLGRPFQDLLIMKYP
jgi:hypothetical protein